MDIWEKQHRNSIFIINFIRIQRQFGSGWSNLLIWSGVSCFFTPFSWFQKLILKIFKLSQNFNFTYIFNQLRRFLDNITFSLEVEEYKIWDDFLLYLISKGQQLKWIVWLKNRIIWVITNKFDEPLVEECFFFSLEKRYTAGETFD